VKAGLTYADVTRNSDTVVTVTLPAFAGYEITATETITATIPATAVSGGSAIVAAPTFDVTAVLKIVKRAFTASGASIASGATVPKGVPFKFVLYINNTDAARADVSLQDVLAAAFAYQAGSMKVSNGIAACAAADCDAGEEATIFTTLNTSGTVVTDAIDDPDVASYAAGTGTIDVGDGTEAGNGQLDINANSVWGLIFDVTLN
jgi:hypothetical protein